MRGISPSDLSLPASGITWLHWAPRSGRAMMDDDRYPYLYESKFPSPMNKSVLKTRTRAVYIGLAMLAVMCWSCTKENIASYTDGTQAEEAIAQARSFYESSAAPLTRSVADQTIAIKPLPGDMTPL